MPPVTGILQPDSSGPQPDLSVQQSPDLDAVGKGLQQLGGVGQGIVQTEGRFQEQQLLLDNRNAVADASEQVSDAATQIQALQEQARTSAKNPAGVTAAVAPQIDDIVNGVIGNQTNAFAKNYAMRTLARVRTTAIDNSQRWEAAALVKYGADQIDTSVNNWGNYVAANPDTYHDTLATVKDQIDAANLGPALTAKMKMGATSSLAMASAQGMFLHDPNATGKGVYALLGLPDPTKPPVLPTAPNPTAPTPSDTDPLGIRNNNPGNIRADDTPWQGKTGANQGFATFDTPENGLRALGTNLLSYQDKHGLNTVQDIIGRWAPPGDNNDTPAYVQAVSKSLGVAPDAHIDLHNPATLTAMSQAIVTHENGQQPYSAAQITGGANAALGIASPAPATPVQVASAATDTMTDVSPVAPVSAADAMKATQDAPSQVKTGTALDDLDWKQLLTLKNRYDEQNRKGQSDAQTTVRNMLQNAGAMAERGMDFSAPSPELLAQAYPDPVKRALVQGNFDAQQHFTQAMRSTQTMTPDQYKGVSATLQPTGPDDPQAAEKLRQSDAFDKAWNATQQLRDKDPIMAAQQQGLGTIKPLTVPPSPMGSPQTTFVDSPTFMAELQNRRAVALNMHNTYGAANLSPFTKDEAQAVAQNFHTMPSSQQLGFLKALRAGLTSGGDDPQGNAVYSAAVSAFAKDSPVIQAAGQFGYWGDGRTSSDGTPANQVALNLLQGDRILYPDKYAKGEQGAQKPYALPPGMDASVDAQLGPAFAGNPAALARASQGVKAYYANASAQQGMYGEAAPDPDRLSDAISKVVGEQSTWAGRTFFHPAGGNSVLMPWGMKQDDFQAKMQSGYDTAMAASGLKGSSVDNPQAANLVRLDEYHYGLQSGGKALAGKDGRPVVIDISPTEMTQ